MLVASSFYTLRLKEEGEGTYHDYCNWDQNPIAAHSMVSTSIPTSSKATVKVILTRAGDPYGSSEQELAT